MLRSSGGLFAYLLKPWKPTDLEDLVGIFDTAERLTPVSVAEQRAFVKQWFKEHGIDRPSL
jgi:hypothetical protein